MIGGFRPSAKFSLAKFVPKADVPATSREFVANADSIPEHHPEAAGRAPWLKACSAEFCAMTKKRRR